MSARAVGVLAASARRARTADKQHILVVMDRVLEAGELLPAIENRAGLGHVRVYLLALADASRADGARDWLQVLVSRLAQQGVEAIGIVGPGTSLDVVEKVWDPAFYDEVIAATSSAAGSVTTPAFPDRIAEITGLPVMHLAPA